MATPDARRQGDGACGCSTPIPAATATGSPTPSSPSTPRATPSTSAPSRVEGHGWVTVGDPVRQRRRCGVPGGGAEIGVRALHHGARAGLGFLPRQPLSSRPRQAADGRAEPRALLPVALVTNGGGCPGSRRGPILGAGDIGVLAVRRAEIIPIEPDLDNASAGSRHRPALHSGLPPRLPAITRDRPWTSLT